MLPVSTQHSHTHHLQHAAYIATANPQHSAPLPWWLQCEDAVSPNTLVSYLATCQRTALPAAAFNAVSHSGHCCHRRHYCHCDVGVQGCGMESTAVQGRAHALVARRAAASMRRQMQAALRRGVLITSRYITAGLCSACNASQLACGVRHLSQLACGVYLQHSLLYKAGLQAVHASQPACSVHIIAHLHVTLPLLHCTDAVCSSALHQRSP